MTQDPPTIGTASPYAHGDGVYYYVYLRSMMFDGDLDFTNDLALLGDPFKLGRNEGTGRPKNFWTGGTALAWAPFAFYARGQLALTNALGWTNEPINGAGHNFQRITLFGSVAAGLVALWFALQLAVAAFGTRPAVFAVFGVALASPLPWYMLRQPSFSHAASAAAVAAFVTMWFRTRKARLWRQWTLLGLLLGVAMLIRPQDALHAFLPFIEWGTLMYAAVRLRARGQILRLVGQGLAFVAAAMSTYLVQVLAWKRIYGRWLLDAHDDGFLSFSSSRFLETLFSSRMGLFAWHPLMYVAVLGLLGAACYKRLPRDLRGFAICSLTVVLLQAVVNGAAVDWWGGWSFGGRRFLGCTIYLVLGLAAAIAGLVHLATRYAAICLKYLLPTAALLIPALFNYQLAMDYMFRRIPAGASQDMLALWTGAASRGMGSLYEISGNVGSAPLNWWLASAADVSPARYDLLSADELFYQRRGPTVLAVTDKRFALRGFGLPGPIEGRLASWVDGEAVWGFALRRAEHLIGHIELNVPIAPLLVTMSVGSHVVLKHEVTTPGWQALAFSVPAAALRSGINLARVSQRGAGGSRAAWGAMHLAPRDTAPPK